MTTRQGASVPPSLTGPTRGELCVRVSRVILRKEHISSAEANLDEPVVQPVWWGEASPSAEALASSGTTARGDCSFTFPVKTTPELLGQYFAHMTRAKTGLALHVTPKGAAAPCGAAVIQLDSLQPGAPVSGWFSIADLRRPGVPCVGRMSVHVSVSLSPQTDTTQGESPSDTVLETAEVPDTHEAEGPTPPAIARPPSRTVEQPLAAPVLVPRLDSIAETERLSALTQRCLVLRDQMAAATDPSSGGGSNAQTVADRLGHAADTPDFLSRVAVVRHEADCDVSSLSGSDSNTDSDGSSSSGRLSEPDQHPGHHLAEPRGHFASVSRHFAATTVTVSASNIVVAHDGPQKVRIGLRLSRDVLFAAPPTSPVAWSRPVVLPGAASAAVEIAAFNDDSKVVVELHGESLVGVAVLPLRPQQHIALQLRHPVRRECLAQATVTVAVDAGAHQEPAAKQRPVAAQLAQPTQPEQPHEEPSTRAADKWDDEAACLVPEPEPARSAQNPTPLQLQRVPAANLPPAALNPAPLRPSTGTTLLVTVEELREAPMVTGLDNAPTLPNVAVLLEHVSDRAGRPLDGWGCSRFDCSPVVGAVARRGVVNAGFRFTETVTLPSGVGPDRLGHLELRVLHCRDPAPYGGDGVVADEAFLRCCACLGSTTVGLPALRHLRCVEGWYHVQSATGPCGQLRVAVRLGQ